VLVTRHMSAGERLESAAADRLRALDAVGRADARALPRVLARHAIDRIVTSPHARCVQTVEPLALERELAIELREELAPDASLDETLALLAELPDASLLCTHREVFERLFRGEVRCEKGGTWLVTGAAGRAVDAREYVPPPSRVRPLLPVG
jgi:phosphohistidine phosphatase SixA